MSTDSFVQVAPDGAGKKVDTEEVTRPDGTVVDRQRVVVVNMDGLGELLTLLREQSRILTAILLTLGSISGEVIDPDNLAKGN